MYYFRKILLPEITMRRFIHNYLDLSAFPKRFARQDKQHLLGKIVLFELLASFDADAAALFPEKKPGVFSPNRLSLLLWPLIARQPGLLSRLIIGFLFGRV